LALSDGLTFSKLGAPVSYLKTSIESEINVRLNGLALALADADQWSHGSLKLISTKLEELGLSLEMILYDWPSKKSAH